MLASMEDATSASAEPADERQSQQRARDESLCTREISEQADSECKTDKDSE
jgi:hypothetical protein